jgi:signal transduction histidine kinase
MSSPTQAVLLLLVTADAELASRITAELALGRSAPQMAVASSLAGARRQLSMARPTVIFLDGSLPDATPRGLLAGEMARHAPVVMTVSPAHHAELAPAISTGEVDCVADAGDFLPVVLALLDRRLRYVKHSMQYAEALETNERVDFGSMLRHELNNPLTGILGNAEMLLRQRERLAGDTLLRVETITNLALRLRETVRRVSNAWEARQQQSQEQLQTPAEQQTEDLSRQQTTRG